MTSKIRVERGESHRIKVSFPYNPVFMEKIKSIKGRRWHPERKYRSFPHSDSVLEKLLLIFADQEVYVDPALRQESEKTSCLEDLRRELNIRKYSLKTTKSYIRFNEDFLQRTNKFSEEVTNQDIKNYLLYLVEKKGVSASTINCAINALKFHYGNILKRRFIYEIKRPRRDKKLPVVLSQNEILKIFSSISNVKHKAILMLIYSAGLRVGEVVRLKPEDIDGKRLLIHVRGSKGRKDRYTLLSNAAIEPLRLYYKAMKPEKWLFPGQNKDKYINTRSVAKIFENAVKVAGINKTVSVHSLRHSFATHLLESGVDIRYIQEILGHRNIKTTEIYTKVSNKDLRKITSPLDLIIEGRKT